MASKASRRIVITTGDSDGIGWEVTSKALNALGPKIGVQFVYFRHAPSFNPKQPKLGRKFRHTLVTSLTEALRLPFDAKTAIEVRSSRMPAHWVEEAARHCMKGDFQAMVTAPLSKTSIIEAGLSDIGHTEILSRVTGTKDLFMGFIGKKFSVLLATGHKPLQLALKELTPKQFDFAIRAAAQLRELLPAAQKKLPIALVGVNPHAGEGGLIGNEEDWMRGFADQKFLVGPLVPDAAFLPQNWKRFSVYLCPYHDQGLIPFKMIHGFTSGVHLTLGLPFVRTSVDHGTAKDLFGKNQAQPGSMKDALNVAIHLSKETAK
ncbi:MAG: 4-hydroxythreonine-4-phosphate dehydrogenase PdxA [Bdellovibrionales bacterium]